MTTIRGLEPLLAARKVGKIQSREVILFADDIKPHAWAKWPDALATPEGAVTIKDDMRVLVGLDVILIANTYGDKPAAIFNKLKDYAKSIVFVVLTMGDGFVWDRINGDRAL